MKLQIIDYLTEKRICDNLIYRHKRVTTIFVTHRLDSIIKADLIVVMDKGLVVEHGTHESLISRKGKYYSLYMSQGS